MSDFERLMRDSLKSVGEDYQPNDPSAARNRFLQRRRRRVFRFVASGVAVTAVAVAVALFVVPSMTPEPQQRVPVVGTREARIAARVDVGESPSGVAVGNGYVWVTNIASEDLTQIDPATNTEVASTHIPGGPDDVLVVDDHAWVTTEEGELWGLSLETDVLEPTQDVGSGGHLDIAGEGEDLFVQETSGPLYWVDSSTGDVLGTYETGVDSTDVAVQGDRLWVYDRDAGMLLQLDRATGEILDETEVGETESQDLAATDEYVWFFRGADANLLQIDTSGAIVSESQLDGTFGAISPTPEGVWVMTTSGGPEGTGQGTLYRIDPQRSQQIGTKVPLTDVPYDVAAGEGAIWITNNSAGTVTRVDVVPSDEPPAPIEAEGEVVFYYGADGDIFAQRADGTSEPVVNTRAYEANPTLSPTGKTLVYQRGRPGSAKAQIWVLALEDETYEAGANFRLMRGGSPSFSSSGDLAWVVAGSGTDDPTLVGVGPIASEPRVMFEPAPQDLGPLLVSRLSWSPGGDVLYYSAGYESMTAYSIEVPNERADADPEPILDDEAGAILTSLSLRSDGDVTAVRLCCSSFPEWDFSTAELVRIGDGGIERIVGLDDFFPSVSIGMFAVPSENLDYETAGGWTRGPDRTWLVGDGGQLWLLAETREANLLAPRGVDGVAIVPGALAED